jgi:hypothetical protein
MTSNAVTDLDLVFVLGTGRCGSSPVAEVLVADQHDGG